ARDFIERPDQFGGILDSQVSACTRPKCSLSRKRISMLGEGKYCGNRIEIPEFFNQLYPVSTSEPQPNHNKIRFVRQEYLSGQRRFVRFAARCKLPAFSDQREHAGPNEACSMNNEYFWFCPAFPRHVVGGFCR